MTSMSRTVAIVTGGCSGLGAGAASALLQRGARVLVADLASEDRRGNLARLWAENWGVQVIDSQGSGASSVDGAAVTFMETDVCVPDQVNSALDAVERCFGEPVSCAVNCAGIALARKTLSKRGTHPLEEFQKVLSVNTVGTFNVACLAAERMTRRNPDQDGLRGCIINTASVAAFEGQMGQVAYAASKGGVVGMTLPMARDLAPNGIRVMTIAPGLFSTPLLDGLPEAVKKELASMVPCPNRLGRPEEFGQLVLSVLDNAMLNGSVIRLDGALRMPP